MKEKKCPVDRARLLISMECCREARCRDCPYVGEYEPECGEQAEDSLAYIGWLEERLKERGDDVLG